MKRLCIALVALLPSSAFALDAYDVLQRDRTTIDPLIEQEVMDIGDDQKEAQLESSPEFFLEDGRGGEPVRDEDPAFSQYVTFRLAGVPYALRDVAVTQWFAPYVRDMAERGIVSGYKDANGIPTGEFHPERSVSIEELAKMTIEAAAINRLSCPAAPKNPLAGESWSAPYIACAESNGFVLFSDGTVDIRRSATRAEVVMTIVQGFGVPQLEIAAEEQVFSDVSASTLFAPAIKTAVHDGIVAGYADDAGRLTGEFKPGNPINRAEVSKMLSIAVQVYGGR